MDSLTQAALGAGLAAACVPPGHRRRALVAGALLGTLPDLDVFIDYGDPVRNFTFHRGFSHSLFVLPPVALAIWLALRQSWQPVREAPRAWLAAILLALVTHPLLDAHTAYGTQLLWPLPTPPVAWSTLFIIDPAFTLPLVAGCLLAATWPRGAPARRALRVALGLAVLYLGWSWSAKAIVEDHARRALAAEGLADAPLFSVPTPFNTLLWRVVVLTDDGYLEGFDSLLVDEGPLDFTAHPSDRAALAAVGDAWAVGRLRWFARDFVAAVRDDGQLVVTDLRMGQEPKYVFRFVVARRDGADWVPVTPVELPSLVTRDDVATVWRRLTGS
ncbi:MAG: metal-dependent hydrolase [Woeseiaceae bacterium]|nr:metal-dependent hydrolase [Woeseiaceae bacterium]